MSHHQNLPTHSIRVFSPNAVTLSHLITVHNPPTHLDPSFFMQADGRRSVLSSVWERELTGRPINSKQFRGIRPLRLKNIPTVKFEGRFDGTLEQKMVQPSNHQHRIFHRLSHDSTCLVSVFHHPWNTKGRRVAGQFVLYDLTPHYIIERIRFPSYYFSLHGTSFIGFNRDSSIFCAINVLVNTDISSEQDYFLTNDPVNIQFGLRRRGNLCLTLNLQNWFEIYGMDKKRAARSILKSHGDIFALNFGRSDISVFGFYDEVPTNLIHAKIFAVERNEPITRENNVSTGRNFKYTVGGLDIFDVLIADGRQKFHYSLVEMNPKLKRPANKPNLYFAHTHIDLERIFKYTSELMAKQMDSKLVSVHRCRAHLLDIMEDGMLHIFLGGAFQISRTNSTLPPFIIATYLVLWNLKTNQIKCQVVGTHCSSSPYSKSTDVCMRGLSYTQQFYDCMTFHDSVFNGDSISAMGSYYGDISLYL